MRVWVFIGGHIWWYVNYFKKDAKNLLPRIANRFEMSKILRLDWLQMWPNRARDYTDYPLSMGYIFLGNKVFRNKSSLVEEKGVEIEGLFFFAEFALILGFST